jgi:glycosyltransferase involved in cell wall biosynthesis
MVLQNTLGDFPLVSIIIPARNEAEDIAETLNTCLAIDYERKEIIVVDDSTDDTPAIVASYADRGVRLIHREKNSNGCCGARNLGIQQARGEIVVLLNADAVPQPNFLKRIIPHYQAGADFLVVRSVLKNHDNIWGCYKHAQTVQSFNPDPHWTEGFSCRLESVKSVGYIPGDFPVPFCRDYMLGANLKKAGFVKHVDMSIDMEHIWPDSLKSFWGTMVHRGAHSAPTFYYFRRSSLPIAFLREMLKAIRTFGLYFLIFPVVWRAYKLSHYTSRGMKNFPSLFFVGLIDDIATIVGNFKGLLRIVRAEMKLKKHGIVKKFL